jgi:sugar phosphate permease
MDDGNTAVMIVAIVFAFVSFSTYLRYRSKKLEFGLDSVEKNLQEENEMLQSKTAQLEKRVQVLESIVTSKDFSLKEEIDSLQ